MPIIKTEKKRKTKRYFSFPYSGVVVNVSRPQAIDSPKLKDIKMFCFCF